MTLVHKIYFLILIAWFMIFPIFPAFSELDDPEEELLPPEEPQMAVQRDGVKQQLVTVKPNELGVEIRVTLPEKSDLDVAILGEGEKTLRALYRGPVEAGDYVFTWDGRDDGGTSLPPGIYTVRVMQGEYILHQEGFFSEVNAETLQTFQEVGIPPEPLQ